MLTIVCSVQYFSLSELVESYAMDGSEGVPFNFLCHLLCTIECCLNDVYRMLSARTCSLWVHQAHSQDDWPLPTVS